MQTAPGEKAQRDRTLSPSTSRPGMVTYRGRKSCGFSMASSSIRAASCPMTEAPGEVEEKQLRDLCIECTGAEE